MEDLENKELVSFVIPCYNDFSYISQAIESALDQTYAHKEIIVVDDGSNIETKKLLEKLLGKIDRLITQENCGQSKARNIGIENAKGEYIVVLDSDDFFEKKFCEEAINALIINPNSRLITCFSWLHYDSGRIELYKPNGGTLKNFLFGNLAMGSVMFKKSEWRIAGKYDELMRTGFEDWEFYIRLLKDGGNALVLEKPLFNYRKRNNSTTKIANAKKYELWRYIFSKHKDLYYKNYDDFLDFFICKLRKEEEEKIKNTRRVEFRLGAIILNPLRQIKRKLLCNFVS